MTTIMLVFVLSGGYAFAQSIDTKETRADTGDKQEVSAVDHTRHCTKDMKNISNHGSDKTLMNQKDDNSTTTKELRMNM